MKLHIIARGKMGRCPEADLIARYEKRLNWPFAITELPDTGGKAPSVSLGTRIVALDEGGAQWPSSTLAKKLEQWRDGGTREVRFLIGAADGLTAEETRLRLRRNRFRGCYLAPHAGARDAGGTTLPCNEHHRRAPLPPRGVRGLK